MPAIHIQSPFRGDRIDGHGFTPLAFNTIAGMKDNSPDRSTFYCIYPGNAAFRESQANPPAVDRVDNPDAQFGFHFTGPALPHRTFDHMRVSLSGSGQSQNGSLRFRSSRRVLETAGVAAIRRGFPEHENTELDRKMPFSDRHVKKTSVPAYCRNRWWCVALTAEARGSEIADYPFKGNLG